MATIVVVNRPGINENTVIPEALLDFGPDAKPLRAVSIPSIAIASKELRERMIQRHSVRYMIPRGVEAYIEAQSLYRGASEPAI